MANKKLLLAVNASFAINFVQGQAGFMKANGWEVYIISPDGPEVRRMVAQEGVHWISVNMKREISPLADMKSFFRLIGAIWKVRPHVINAGTPKAGLLVMSAAIFYPFARRIFTLRGLRSDTLTGQKQKLVRTMEKISCSLAQEVIVISPSLKNYAQQLGILSMNKGYVIGKGSSNGVNLQRFNPSETEKQKGYALKNRLGIPDNAFVIGFVGRQTKDKGVEEMYHAFLRLSARYPQIHLVMVGPVEADDPVDSDIVEAIAAHPRIHCPGSIQDVAHVYAFFHVLLLVSHREGFGNVVIEAAAMECPAIVSDIPGCRDTVEPGVTGYHVPLKNIDALADTMEKYILDPALARQHGIAACHRAREFFASVKIWDGQLALYEQQLSA